MNKIICTVSGGIDSTVCLAWLVYAHNDVLPVYVHLVKKNDYAVSLVEKIVDYYRVKENINLRVVEMDVTQFSEKSYKYQDPYIGGYGMFLYTSLLAVADVENIEHIYTGEHRENISEPKHFEKEVKPGRTIVDTHRIGIKKYVETYNSIYETQIDIISPFLGWEKEKILKLGQELNVPFDLTSSCFSLVVDDGTLIHCGRCIGCSYRHQSFKRAGIKDSTKYQVDPL